MMSAAASEYDGLMRQLLVEINAGHSESAWANALRDKMDAPWTAMTAQERTDRDPDAVDLD